MFYFDALDIEAVGKQREDEEANVSYVVLLEPNPYKNIKGKMI